MRWRVSETIHFFQFLRTKPTVVPWEETRAQWAARASRGVKAINSEFNAKGLFAEFPGRLRQCMENGGERLET